MNKFNLLKNNTCFLYLIIGLFSAITFCSIYGLKILNPTYTDWLLNAGGDLTQHYLGWKAYRNSAWKFPIGMLDTLAYPHQSSIIYTDSIPLMAVFFKLLSPVLTENFQYFGLYGLLCFILQGILAARIINNFCNNKIAVAISSIIFLYAPVMLFRMYSHTALASHWIILLALEPVFLHKKYQNNKKIYLIVALIGILSASTHIYFVLMSGIILVGICLTNIILYKNIKRSILLLVEYLCAGIVIISLLGGFSGKTQADAWGLGVYSFNLNAFFNPQTWSCMFKDLPLYGDKQYEGFAWLGSGIIILLIFAVVLFTGGTSARQCMKIHWKEFVLLCIISGIAIIAALSPVITFGDNVLLELKLPDFIIRLWSIFRSSGRIAWITIYIIMLCCCIVLSKILNERTLIILLILGVILQIYDSHTVISSSYKRFTSVQTYNSSLDNEELWNKIADNDKIEHVVYCSAVQRNTIFPLSQWALEHGKTLNTFYFARSNAALINESIQKSLSSPSVNEIFVFTETDRVKCIEYSLHYYALDGFIVGYIDKIDGFEEINPNDIYLTWNFGNNQYIKNETGRDTDKGRELYSNGFSYGPYWTVPAGYYTITVLGENLSEAVHVSPYSDHGKVYYNFSIIKVSETEIVLNLSVEQDASDMEICVLNNGQESIVLKEIKLEIY